MTNSEFEKIIHNYEKLVFTICYQMVRDYHEAQNLTQETFLSAYTHIDSCTSDNFKAWLARIATNKAKDFLKSAYNNRILLDNAADTEQSLLDTGQSADTIFKTTESDMELKSIYGKIETLKEPYNKISVLYFIEDKNVDEISSILDRPKKTIQTQIYRARQLLQSILKGEM